MTTTHTDIHEGERLSITVEFVSQRVVRCDSGTVYRLLVADDSGTQFPVLATSDRLSPAEMRTCGSYRISGLLGADPSGPTGEADAGDCPDCGEPLRPERVLDTVSPEVEAATTQLGIEEQFGILDDQASIHPTSRVPVGDWVPMGSGSAGGTRHICVSCGHRVESATGGECSDPGTRDQTSQRLSGVSGLGATTPTTVAVAASVEPTTTTFRSNLTDGYIPQPAAICDELLFSEHRVEAGNRTGTGGLFVPRLGAAVSEHPLTGVTEQYLSVGLEATLPAEAFERPRLDLVVVLDVSGSMGEPFGDFSGDSHPGQGETKLEAAQRALTAVAGQLDGDDRLGVVLCNHRAHVAKPLQTVARTDLDAMSRHASEVDSGGETDLGAGIEAATELLAGDGEGQTERRIVLLSDLRPTTEAADELTTLLTDAATRGIHATMLGVGTDLNAKLAATLGAVRGANYRFLPPAGFERQLDEVFDCMVSPVVFDLTLELRDGGSEFADVHGCPPTEPTTDQFVHAGSLFPCLHSGSVYGGPVLVQLGQISAGTELELVVSWTERGGGEHRERVSVTFPDESEAYTDDGVRTAVALARYGRELRAWAADRHGAAGASTDGDGCCPGQQSERGPVALTVSSASVRRFERLRAYLEHEMEHTSDRRLQCEVDLLEALCRHASKRSVEVVN